MDKARWGSFRWGHFRWGVYRPDFDRVVDRLEKTSAKSMGGIDPDIFGERRWGMFRYDVYIPLFDGAVTRLEKTSTPHVGVMDGTSRKMDEGPTLRMDMLTDHWNRMIERFKKVS